MYPSAGRETPQHLRHAVRVLLQCTLLACLLLPIAGFAQKAVNASATPQAKASYPAQRDRLQADLTRVRREGSQAQVVTAMAALRDLANANGDTDLAQRMEVERIFAVHDDAAIDDSLAQLNRIRAELNPEASAELQEALARVYGNLYFDVGNYGLALQHQLEALTWADKLPRDARQARLYRLSTIAELYNAMDLPEHALRYAEQAMAQLDAQPDANTQKGTRISVMGARAQAYMALRQYDTAARILQQAEQLDGNSAPGFNTLRLAANRANLAIATGDAANAAAAVSRLQQLATEQDNSYYQTRAQLLLGHSRIIAGDLDGRTELRSAVAAFAKLGQMGDVLDGHQREAEAMRARKAWPEAVEAMQRQQALWVRMFRSEQMRGVSEQEARHRAQQREQRIAALNQQVTLDQSRLRASRLLVALAAALAVLAAIIAGLLMRSRRRARQERDRLSDAVRYDPLTGALSRYEFQRRHAPKDGNAAATSAASPLLLLDLDDFKAVNDQHGHEAGDAVLKTLVERLQVGAAPDDAIYRWGGEEFLLVLSERDDAGLEARVHELLQLASGRPVRWQSVNIPIAFSGGLVRTPLAPGWNATLADALRWADAALYHSKYAGRGQVTTVRITATGANRLGGRRPIDLAQLQDWQRQGLVALDAITARPGPVGG